MYVLTVLKILLFMQNYVYQCFYLILIISYTLLILKTLTEVNSTVL